MEHYPGSELVRQAHEALSTALRVGILVEAVADPIWLAGIDIEGPFARCDQPSGYTLVRLDKIIGVLVLTDSRRAPVHPG